MSMVRVAHNVHLTDRSVVDTDAGLNESIWCSIMPHPTGTADGTQQPENRYIDFVLYSFHNKLGVPQDKNPQAKGIRVFALASQKPSDFANRDCGDIRHR
jgi:hypothetical protein